MRAQEEQWGYWVTQMSADLYTDWSAACRSLDSARFYALQLEGQPLLPLTLRIYQIKAAEYHFQLDSMQAWIRLMEAELAQKESELQQELGELKDQLLLYKGIHAYMIKDLYWAENEAFAPLVAQIKARPEPTSRDSNTLATSLRYLGSICEQLHRYAEAIEYYEAALSLDQKLGKKGWVMLSHSHLGTAYEGSGQLDSARKHYVLAYHYFEEAYKNSPNRNRTSYVSSCKALAQLERHDRNFARAGTLIQEVLSSLDSSHNLYHEARLEEARILIEMDDLQEAQTILQQTLEWYRQGKQSAAGEATSLGILADAAKKQRDWARAISYLQEAREVLQNQESSTRMLVPTVSPAFYLELLASEARVRSQLCKENPEDLQARAEARRAYDRALAWLDTLRWQTPFEDDLVALTEASYSLFEDALRLESELSQDGKTMSRAWKWMHLSHGLALRKARQGMTYRHNWSDSLRRRYQTLARHTQKAYGDWIAQAASGEEAASLKQTWFAARQEQERWLKSYAPPQLQAPYPGLAAVQKELNRETALIAYLQGDQCLYRMLVKQEMVRLDTLSWSEMHEEQIYAFQQTIWGPYQSEGSFTSQRLVSGQQLHSWLIGELESELPNTLCIMPDGALWHVPYDLLTTYEGQAWIGQHNWSLGYTAENFQREPSGAEELRLLAMAPSFPQQAPRPTYASLRAGIGPLVHNQSEVQAIQQIAGGDLLMGEQASRSHFLEQAGQYDILHLATHGIVPDEDGKWAFLAFSAPGDTLWVDEEALPGVSAVFAREIQQMDLPVELVVLSACKTGVGRPQRGEGVQSLARAFMHAGARSLVATLWSVDDQITARLMELFYANLERGDSPAEALHAAKTTLWEAGENPYYWAGFVLIGKAETETSPPFSLWLTLLLVGLLGLLAWGVLKKRRAGKVGLT